MDTMKFMFYAFESLIWQFGVIMNKENQKKSKLMSIYDLLFVILQQNTTI